VCEVASDIAFLQAQYVAACLMHGDFSNIFVTFLTVVIEVWGGYLMDVQRYNLSVAFHHCVFVQTSPAQYLD
jgi:hypothetical protein